MRRTAITALVLLAIASSSYARVWMSPDDYLALRRQSKAAMGQAAADASAGSVVELQGVVSGVAEKSDGSAFVLTSGSRSLIVTCRDPDPQVDPGSKVRMLAKVGAPDSPNDLILMGVAWDYIITEREKAAMANAKRAVTQKKLTSRGNYQRSDVLAGKWTEILEPYKKAIQRFNPKLTASQAQAIACYILEYSERYDVDPRLVVSVILAESHFRLGATSRAGAMGLGQLMPGTAAGLGVTNAYDPHQNLRGSIRLIRGHLDRLSGGAKWNQLTWQDLALALASYNAGPGAVRKYGGVPPYRETQTYIARVTQIYKQLCGYR